MKRRQLKRYVVGFDTEDDGSGNPFLWCFVHRYGSKVARASGEALEWLVSLRGKMLARGCQVEVWATNLEYDLCNLFPRDRVAEVTWYFGRSYLCSARWRGVDFRDTVRHLPASVADLGGLVGVAKLETTLFDSHGNRPDPVKDFERYRVRCLRDAAITYRAARELHRSYARLKVRARTTLASTALALWRERYWKRAVVRPDPRIWRAAHQAYHGGRTQALAVGTFHNVTVIDVASMFPWAMTCAPLPLPWGMVTRAREGDPVEPNGIYCVDVSSELALPCLPVRTPRGTVYPNGRWRAWYVGDEIRAFQAYGGRARVIEGYVFRETCEPFNGYVRSLFRLKARARGLKRTLYKLMLNGLYGKFGQQGMRVRCVSLERFQALDAKPLHAREWNGLVIYREDGLPPPWGNEVWPAFVTARARMRLMGEMVQLAKRGARPLYCDTDSVMFQGDPRGYPERADVPGTFEIKGRFRRLLIVGKKEYALETEPGQWHAYAKGVPLLERYAYLRTGRASFQRPVRLRESAATGNVVNVWRTVTKQRRTNIANGPLLADGTVPPPRIIRDDD